MRKIFIGLLFIFFNFNITLDLMILPLLPDFVGYLLISAGAKQMIDKSVKFDNVSAFTRLLAIIFFVFFLMDIFTISTSMSHMTLFNWLLGFVITAIELYLLYLLTKAILDIKTHLMVPSDAQRLFNIFKYHAISALIASVFIVIAPVLSILAIISTVLFAILYLVIFNRIKKDLMFVEERG